MLIHRPPNSPVKFSGGGRISKSKNYIDKTFCIQIQINEMTAGQFLIILNTTTYYVLSEELHGYMFRQIGGHLQAIQYSKIKLHLQVHF